MIKRKIVYTICLFFAFTFVLTGCGAKNEEISQNDIIELSQKAVEKAHIKSEVAVEKEVESTITTTAQVKSNEDTRYVLSSVVAGKIIKDNGKLGDYVHAGQIIAFVQNPEVVKINSTAIRDLHENNIAIRQAQNKYKLAKTNYDREEKLYSEGISPQRDLLQAKTDMLVAKDDLENLRRRNQDIKSEANALLNIYGTSFNSSTLSSLSPIKAIKSGIITKKNVTVGAVVTTDQVLYEIQDLSNLWLDITLYSNNINKIKKNQLITFVSDSFPDKTFEGKIDYIQPVSDNLSQTFLARAFIDNSLGLLKPGMFGNAIIKSDVKEKKVFLPEGAIQKYGKENFVFLNLGDNKFKKVNVDLGEKLNDKNISGYFINSGVQAGDEVVVEGSFTLKAEMLKSEFAEED
jgi:cobalt-zinc-cadmium efflux system membrane fusion protein